MNILHLTFNYPDEITPRTTPAVKRLIDSARSFATNHCVSLHNGFPRWRTQVIRHPDHTVVSAWGLPFFLGSRQFLTNCLAAIRRAGLVLEAFDLIHAHRLTMEGIIASRLAGALDIPYCLSVRATDLEMLDYKPYLRGRYLAVLRGARRIGVIAPWLAQGLCTRLGPRWDGALEHKLVLLGNVVDGEPVQVAGHNGRYVMPFAVNRSQLRRKNVLSTLEAVARLARQGRRVELDILGDGSGTERVAAAVRRLGLAAQVRLCGHVPHAQMRDTLAGYKALLLCSHPETFGLVYIEALISGIPVVHSRETGIDGLFPGFQIGPAADPRSVESIACAIEAMEQGHEAYKAEVGRLQVSGPLRFFHSEQFAERLRTTLYGPAAGDEPAPVETAAAAAKPVVGFGLRGS